MCDIFVYFPCFYASDILPKIYFLIETVHVLQLDIHVDEIRGIITELSKS